jgi:ubiquitin carboxyl-terminal hydrolase 4/11/15
VIVDLMHGLYKSTVRCPDCNRLSVTFEPYMNITLPIPEVKLILKNFYWIPFDTSKRNILYKFSIKSHLQIRSLKEFISNTFKTNKYGFDLALIEDD